MKKIIYGRKYDTETARCIAEDANGLGWRDFRNYEEELYRKKTGEFFLHGKGGPMTKYAIGCADGGWSGGEKILPLSDEEAREWVEKHCSTEEYEEVFGETEE